MSTSNRQSFIVEPFGPDPGALRQALAWSVSLALQDASGQVTIVAGTRRVAEMGTLGEVVGQDHARSLASGKTVLIDGVRLRLESRRTVGHENLRGHVVALYPRSDLLDVLDGL